MYEYTDFSRVRGICCIVVVTHPGSLKGQVSITQEMHYYLLLLLFVVGKCAGGLIREIEKLNTTLLGSSVS